MKLIKHHAKILVKIIVILYFNFWPQKAKKKPKKGSKGHNKSNKFCILDETKYNSENFNILYFIFPK